MELTGPPSQLTPSTSQGIPDSSSVEPEAMDTGALSSLSAAESEEVSEGSSEVEDLRLLRADRRTQDRPKVEPAVGRVLRLVRNVNLRWGLQFLGVKLKIYE